MSERSTFELPDFLWDALRQDAESQGKSQVKLLREIIESSNVDTAKLKRTIISFRLGEEYIKKLQDMADEALPEKMKGRKRGNKSAALQEILTQYFNGEKSQSQAFLIE